MEQFIGQEAPMQEELDDEEGLKIAELIDNSDIKDEDKKRIIAHIRSEEFNGPLPHPELMRQYEEIQPGFANQIMQMALEEQGHRHDMEKKLVESQTSLNSGQLEIIHASIKLKTRLQLFGFGITTLLAIVGSVCLLLDKNMNSLAPFILAVGSFCWTMFYGKKQPDEESKGDEESKESDGGD